MATKDPARSKALNASYAETTAWLIENHRAEFDKHRAEVLAAKGIEWSPKPTQEQKDEEVLRELLERNPKLARIVTGEGQRSAASVKPDETAVKADPHS
jgi:hypothetical protein